MRDKSGARNGDKGEGRPEAGDRKTEICESRTSGMQHPASSIQYVERAGGAEGEEWGEENRDYIS